MRRLLREGAFGRFLSPGDDRLRMRVRSNTHSSLYHQGAIRERLLAELDAEGVALASDLSSTASSATSVPAPRLDVEVISDVFHIVADASGEPLHERGWRVEGAKMPLKESIAAGMLMVAGWPGLQRWSSRLEPTDSSSDLPSLVDPFCGAGTIPSIPARSNRPPLHAD